MEMIIECFSGLTCDELSSRYITVDSLLGPGAGVGYLILLRISGVGIILSLQRTSVGKTIWQQQPH